MVGNYIRTLREQRNLLLREVAATMAMDQALLSKIERGERQATRQQIIGFANFFRIDEASLISQWLGEKIAADLSGELFAKRALETAKKILEKHEVMKS